MQLRDMVLVPRLGKYLYFYGCFVFYRLYIEIIYRFRSLKHIASNTYLCHSLRKWTISTNHLLEVVGPCYPCKSKTYASVNEFAVVILYLMCTFFYVFISL
jgi:hypothetical protein